MHLDALQIPHHYADEAIFDAIGSVSGNAIRIGKVCYHTVILPQLSNLSSPIASALRTFSRNGGRILIVKNRCETANLTIDGEPAPREFLDWFTALPVFSSEEEAADAAAKAQKNRVTVRKDGERAAEILCASRLVTIGGKQGRFYYFVNRDPLHPVRVQIGLPATDEEVELLDVSSGRFSVVTDAEKTGNSFCFPYTFAPASDAGFFVTARSGLPSAVRKDPFAAPALRTLGRTFTLKEYSGNLLTLDNCRCRFQDGSVRQYPVVDLQTHLLCSRYNGPLKLEYEFFCDDDFPFRDPPSLILETPELFRLSLNGIPLDASGSGYLFDRAFHRIPLSAPCRPGRNLLSLSLNYAQEESVYRAIEAARKFESENNKLRFGTELESVYLYGDFSVRHHGPAEVLKRNAVRYNGTFSLGAPLRGKTLNAGDLTGSGLPFFCGKMTLTQTFRLTEEECRAFRNLRLKLRGANSCRLKINARDAGGCFWEPFAWEVAPYLTAGENTLEAELTTSLRNMLGPHHLEEGEPCGVSPISFLQAPGVTGCTPPPGNPGYCFVQFGLENLEFFA